MEQLLAEVPLARERADALRPAGGGVVAVIPARGGSKGVPGKNLRKLNGLSLVARAVRSCAAVPGIDLVVVSTDDARIAEAARSEGAHVVERPAHLADDEASSESALVHALGSLGSRGVRPEVTVLVQATSPFINPADLARAVGLVDSNAADVAFSVVRTHTHLWREGSSGPVAVNHDARVRLRRQDRQPEFNETGAFYVMRTAGFLERGHRFFGRLHLVEVAAGDALEIDTEYDLRLAHAIADRREEPDNSPIPAKAVVTDFDGVHTDDTARVDQDGTESVVVSRSDGMGVKLLREAGIPTLILSTETNPVVAARAAKLGVEVLHGVDDKAAVLTGWAADHDIDLADIAYLGNDINDISCLALVGHGAVVSGAHPSAREAATHLLSRRGGDGAVRELAERVLAAATTAAVEERTN